MNVHCAGVVLQGNHGGPVERCQAVAIPDSVEVLAGNRHFRLPERPLVGVFLQPEAHVRRYQRAVMMGIPLLVPSPDADFGGGKVLDLALKLLAVLAANGNIHRAHRLAETVTHVDRGAVVSLEAGH